MEENEKKKKSRGWVKDAAIIFLAVLLVLTFFSNTILNRSLPEVATVYVQEGTITNKVRGTGTISARENYEVTIEQTRQVQNVLVRVGDEVRAGDVLFTLQPGDSDELEMAEKQLKTLEKDLRNLESEYQVWLLGLTETDDYEQDQAVSDAREALQEARTAQEEAAISEEDRAEYEAELAELEAEIEECKAMVEAQQAVVDQREADVKALQDGELRELELRRRELQDEKEAKELIVREKQSIVDEKQSVEDAAQKKVDEAKAARSQYSSMDPSYSPVTTAETQLQDARDAVAAAEENLSVKMVLYSADYELLVQEANLLAYNNEVYELEKDAEPTYRKLNGLGSGTALTPAQQAEMEAMLAAEIAKLGPAAAYETGELSVYLAVAAQKTAYPERVKAYSEVQAAKSALDQAKSSRTRAEASYNSALSDYLSNSGSNSNYNKYDREVTKAQDELDRATAPLVSAQADRDKARAEVNLVQQAIDDLNSTASRLNNEDLKDLNDALTEARNRLTELEGERTKAEQALDKLKSDMKTREDTCKNAGQTVKDRERALDRAIRTLESTQKSDDVQQLRNAMTRQDKLDAMEDKKQDIADQEAKIEELLGADSGNEVKSKVSGKVQSLSVTAGRKAEAGRSLAVIEVPDLGYSMNFSVTNEQARRLKVGDSATVSNFYWGSQIVATLSAIQTDPQNPQGSKLLTFDVTGDVTVGNSLTISIGERNANYDMVVPNSAVRSDTNGSFVLMITAKNSPLGNRYFASRVNVEVIASDDQYSAISGAIDAYDSVITTASRNAPISSGDQVRLADSN